MARTAGMEGVGTIGYRRVSKQEQAAEWKSSLEDQTKALLRRAAQLGRTLLPEHVFEDRFSGEEAEDRTGFMALVEFCRTHPRPRRAPGIALFLNDSRFGRFRDPDEAAWWRFQLASHGWGVRFAENDDTEQPGTRHLLRAVGGAQASEYLMNLKRNARRGARGAAGLGLWPGPAPVGYRRRATAPGREPVVLEIGERKSRDQKVRLTPGPETEVEAVRWAFETYAGGEATLAALRAELRARVPRLQWDCNHVKHMLRNRVYLGEVTWCRRPHDKRERRATPLRPRGDWVVTPDAHPPLVSAEVFDAVQARLDLNRRRRPFPRGRYVLRGVVRCASCGMPFIAGGGKPAGEGAEPDRHRFYIDSGATAGTCAGRAATIHKRLLENAVITEVARGVSHPRVQEMIHAEIDRRLAELHPDPAQAARALERERKRLLGERERLVRGIAAGTVSPGEAAAGMEEVRAGEARVQEQLRSLAGARASAAEIERERECLVRLAADFAARARELSGPALRELLLPWIQDAVFDKETRVLTLRIRRVPDAGSRARPVSRRIHFPGAGRDRRTGQWTGTPARRGPGTPRLPRDGHHQQREKGG